MDIIRVSHKKVYVVVGMITIAYLTQTGLM